MQKRFIPLCDIYYRYIAVIRHRLSHSFQAVMSYFIERYRSGVEILSTMEHVVRSYNITSYILYYI